MKTSPWNFGTVSSDADYQAVLSLRYRAYAASNKLRPDAVVADMADEFDARSRILVARDGDRIVGSVRVIIHGAEDQLSYGRYFETPPTSLPPRENYVEASRLCIDPEYRGLRLFQSLAERMVEEAVATGRRYIVGGAAGEITEKWERFGFSRLGIRYVSRDIAGIPHDLILLDTQSRRD